MFRGAIKDVWVIMDNPIDKNDILEYKEMKLIFQKKHSVLKRRSFSWHNFKKRTYGF